MNDRAPQRAFSIELKVGADTLQEAANLLEHFADQIRLGGSASVTGGPSSGGYYEVRQRDVTHEQYAAELKAYLAKERA